MRVIAGKFKGFKLKTPKGNKIRPTSDRVKESLFNIIQNKSSLVGSKFLDLFAGTGNIGIEALSRGAERCVFVDKDFESINIIKQNIIKTRSEYKTLVLKKDVLKALNALFKKGENFDFIFLDPPYGKNLELPVLEKISNYNLIKSDGWIIVEHNKKQKLPERVNDIYKAEVRNYGSTMISIYTKEG